MKTVAYVTLLILIISSMFYNDTRTLAGVCGSLTSRLAV